MSLNVSVNYDSVLLTLMHGKMITLIVAFLEQPLPSNESSKLFYQVTLVEDFPSEEPRFV